MAGNILAALFGSQKEKDIKEILPVLHSINALEPWAMSLQDSEFPKTTIKFKKRLAEGETLDDLLPEAFALAREAGRRKLGERSFDVQLIGAIALHHGKIVEMKTGEGKTLSSVAAVYLNALLGNGVHIITVNDYLAERDSQWMGQIYSFLGLSVGCILSSMDNATRKNSYACDITYGTNNEFGFDYLRDNMVWSLDQKVQRGHPYCIIDEIDSILIDEARTPLIISGPADDDTYKVNEVNRLSLSLSEVKKNPETGEYPDESKGEQLEGDFKIDEKSKRVMFTSEGLNHIESLLQKRNLIKGSLFEPQNFEFAHYFTQAVRSQRLFAKDVDYVVQDNLVQIVDEFTGRILHGRRYSDGLHEAIEAKEHIKIARRNRTLATITFQNYFRLYKKLAGMTGTADTEAEEFNKIYNLNVTVIPTNRPVIRLDENDLVYLNEAEKFDAIVNEIKKVHATGQPILVGTVSIEKSEHLSSLLIRQGVRHEVLNAKNHAREALIIAEAGAKGSVTIATNMAGRGTDIKLGGNPEFRARRKAGTDAPEEKYREILSHEYEFWSRDYEEIRSFGGLCVIGTERHESRRIDNQLRGRSGRQGDPGRSIFFISLDDDLMRLFGGENFKQLMGRAGMKGGEAIYHPLLNKSIESAQKKVEQRNFEIRKHLLEYDDVLNKQRNFIYDQRNAILSDSNLTQRVKETALEMLQEQSGMLSDTFKDNPSKTISDFCGRLFDTFGIDLSAKRAFDLYHEGTLTTELEEIMALDLNKKIEAASAESLNYFIRFSYLQEIDEKWLDHLESMEALREAVYLRSYAQKNPLLEYKLEGSDIFESLILSIRHNIASKVYRVRIQESTQTRDAEISRSPRIDTASTNHQTVGSFASELDSVSTESAIATAASPSSVTVVRQGKKIGRNDPCPCGSGKKYKYCHGK